MHFKTSDTLELADCLYGETIGGFIMGIIVMIVLGVIVLGAVAGIICYRKFTLPHMQPLSMQDLEICRDIVAARRGYPWICRRTLKTGECPCYPCEKLLVARGLVLQR
jgi:hypothetical protein